MWIGLNDENLIPRYEAGFSERAPASPALIGLLRELSRSPFAASVWAVTTHGHLRLTTAPSYKVELSYGTVHITPKGEGFWVSHLPAGASEAQAEELCAEGELLTLVTQYVRRYLLNATSTSQTGSVS